MTELTPEQEELSKRFYEVYKTSNNITHGRLKISPDISHNGYVYKLIQQNPHSFTSMGEKWRKLVNEGFEVVQLTRDRKYIGVYVNGRLELYNN